MEYKFIDSKTLGLTSRVKLISLDANHIGIIKKRKSRIIMKDAKQLREIANTIWQQKPDYKISVLISGPICSKSKSYLEEHNISIISE